jgi:hypothetical protein
MWRDADGDLLPAGERVNSRQWGVVVALLLLSVAGIVAAVWAQSRAERPPIPDVLAQVEAAERRVHHIYMLHSLGGDGPQGPWICEPANVGTEPRRGRR